MDSPQKNSENYLNLRRTKDAVIYIKDILNVDQCWYISQSSLLLIIEI